MKNLTQSVLQKILCLVALVAFQANAVAQRASGIDVSRFQGTINWTSVKGSGVTFAWAQATRGAYLTNVNFTANMVNGKAAGVLMGAYHYAEPGTNSPSTEANYFWNVAGPYILADGKTFMPMLDMEVFNGHVGATSYSDWANQWYNNVVAKANAAGVTIHPVMYSSASFFCNFDSSCSAFGSWVANYNGQNPQTGTPWSCCSSCDLWGSGVWNFWQYSSTGAVPGISGNCDLDVFNGTTAQLSTWVIANAGAPVISNVAAGNISDVSATITWNTDINSDSVVNYGLTTSYGTTVSNGTMVVSHSINLSSLSPLTLYHYRVKSKNAGGQLSTSGDFTFTTLASGQVSDIIIDNTGAAVVSGSWSTGTSATDKYGADYRYKSGGGGAAYLKYVPNIVTAGNYQVYEWHPQGANRTTGAQEIVTDNGGSHTFTINQQVNGGLWNLLGTFSFAVGTGNVEITDGHTDTANVVMADAIKFVYVSAGSPPAAPSGLTATAASISQINLSWTDNSANESNFIVARSSTSGGPYTDIATLAANTTSYSNTGLAENTTYYYVVRASNASGSSANSNQASATTQLNSAAAGGRTVPSSVNAGAVFSASITMTNTGTSSWTSGGNYNLGSQTPPDNTTWGFNRVSLAGTVTPNTAVMFNFNATAPTAAGTYNFDWKMVQDGVEWFGAVNAGTIVVNAASTPAAPSNLAASPISSSAIKLTWTDNSGNELNFLVARSTTSGGPYTDIATLAANTTVYTNTSLTAGTTYYYVVRASNGNGSSLNSNQASAAPVADIIIDNGAATVVGSWSTGTTSTDKFGSDYRYKASGSGSNYLKYTPTISTAGNYQVYEWHPQGSNRPTDAPIVTTYNGGSNTTRINQQINGGVWNLVGTFNFASGTTGNVKIQDNFTTPSAVVMADAIKFVLNN